MNTAPTRIEDLVCFSHVGWHSVYQRPHHLLSRFSKNFRVWFVEGPTFHAMADSVEKIEEGNIVLVRPKLVGDENRADADFRTAEMLADFFRDEEISDYMFWYYTATALRYTRDFQPQLVVYDCVNLSVSFKGTSEDLKHLEHELTQKADLVFAAGPSIYEVKKKQHHRTYLFPGSIDKKHFRQARGTVEEPADQEIIPRPRFGFFGVIDERLDMELLENVSRLRPSWQFVMIGPVQRISRFVLPNFPNIHYLGEKQYGDLPRYLAGWDAAIIPYVHMEATRYVSPLKTVEYLAGGKHVIATPIIDVIRPYGNKGLVQIAGTPEEFVKVAELILQHKEDEEWIEKVDTYLAATSWDATYNEMLQIIRTTLVGRPIETVIHEKRPV